MDIAMNVTRKLALTALVAVAVLWFLGPSTTRAERGEPAAAGLDALHRATVPSTTGPFAVPTSLRPAVDFWKKIFTVYTTNDAVVHHATNLGVIYSVLDLRGVDSGRSRKAIMNREIRRILRRHPGLKEEDIHIQYGIRDRFERGLVVSHRYLPEIEEIFREEGLPIHLTRLPFVESSFNVNAYSKAAASGIWQFIPSTGRLYMTVGPAVDERNDPIISSRAAAQLLKHNYEVTGNWPLAITAYNHGLGGVVRGARVTGSRNLVDIIRRYRAANFGFASRNFYAEFLAAVEVYRDHERHFGNLRFDRPFAYDEIRLGRPMLVRDLLDAGFTTDELRAFNPALTSLALSNRVPVPSGCTLRVPIGRGSRMVASLRDVTPVRVKRVARETTAHHRVRRGETLRAIARRYGVNRVVIARANGISTSAKLRYGQVLRVPGVTAVLTRIVRTEEPAPGRAENAVLVRSSDPKPIQAPRRLAQASPSSGSTPRSAKATAHVDATTTILNHQMPVVRSAPDPSVPRVTARVEATTVTGNKVSSGAVETVVRAAPESAASPPGPAPAARRPISSTASHAPAREEIRVARTLPTASPKSASRRKPLPSPGAVLGVSSAEAAELAPPKASSRHRLASRDRARSRMHVVRRNETLWKIARRYDVPVSTLKSANSEKTLTPLRPGTRLRIPIASDRS